MDWQLIRKLFQFSGKLPGVHYQARVAVFELRDPAASEDGNEVAAASEPKLLTDLSTIKPGQQASDTSETMQPREI